mmetsp:Transcript_22833/g.74377  ORF Transcript_22833/g.74377 Transcript_22833/m.74377 type:complete len:266 (-) Transcript_22833:35-832(-)
MRMAALSVATCSSPSATLRSREWRDTFFVPCTASGLFAASESASFSASASSAARVGASAVTRPIARASSASKRRPVSESSRARPSPIIPGSRWSVPKSAVIAKSTSFTEKYASAEAMRMSAAVTISMAPPTHAPWMAAITGRGHRSRLETLSCKARIPFKRRTRWRAGHEPPPAIAAIGPPSPLAPRSIPAQKCFPSPPSTTTRMSSSHAQTASKASGISSHIRGLAAFAFAGLFRFTNAMPSRRDTVSVSKDVCIGGRLPGDQR